MKNILLAVTGGIAAYKAIDLTSKLTQNGYVVRVMLTENAQQFVTPLAFQAISRIMFIQILLTKKMLVKYNILL